MSVSNVKTDLVLSVPFYKDTLSKFDFAKPFMDNPDIFNSNSPTSRNFLIQAFAYIHPDFHYLSFLNKEIDQEIIKVAEILQILPSNIKKTDKLFDNLSDSEIKQFWCRLFALLNSKDNDFSLDTIRTSWEKKFGFFKDISKTLDYVHYELPVLKQNNLNIEALNDEIEKWNNLNIKCMQYQDDSFTNCDAQEMEYINTDKLLMDLKQVISVLKNTDITNNANRLEHLEFFSTFTSLAQNIDQHVINLKEMSSSFLDELHQKMLSESKVVQSSTLYFLKRCSNFFSILEHKNKLTR